MYSLSETGAYIHVHPAQHAGHFGDQSFQAITSTAL